ncbi:MAG: hypothetical protein GX456_04445 [Verrucomicrobia bacterium]|nr:hypothetical protein [Verrucomicrobiota bacterium]
MTDTILWRPRWSGLGRHYGVIFEVSEDRGVPLAGFGAGGANRVTDTIFARLDVTGLIELGGSGHRLRSDLGNRADAEVANGS